MNAYKKDFENSIEFIEWQNTMLKKQADRIADLETALAFKKMKPLNKNEIYDLIINKVSDYELCRAIEERHGIK